MCMDRRNFFKMGAAAVAMTTMAETLDALPLPQAAAEEIKNLKAMTARVCSRRQVVPSITRLSEKCSPRSSAG